MVALDLTSFLGGILAGAGTTLAVSLLYRVEKIVDLQESVRNALHELEERKSRPPSNPKKRSKAEAFSSDNEYEMLESKLKALQEEIRRLYRKSNRW